jgi:2-polyprenyl-3-methyl-5-hydroxy-6-metoxy-1,4-benzoquinol methylase
MARKKKAKEEPKVQGKGHIYLGIPRERLYIPEFVDCRDKILIGLSKQGIGSGYFQAAGHRVDKNRDRIVESFLTAEDKPEWLLMLDSDMEHPEDIANRLMKHNKPIVGALYFHRGDTHDPFVFKYVGLKKDVYGRMSHSWAPLRDLVYKFLSESGIPMADGSFVVNNPPFDPLIECDAVATGAMMIHRSVLEKMEKPIFEYEPMAISEDLMFCLKAKQYGFPIYCDLSTISGHYSFVPMGQAQFRVIHEMAGIRFTTYNQQDAWTDIAEYLSIPVDEAKTMVIEGNAHMVGDHWNEVKPQTPEEVTNFYKDPITGHKYIIELLHWNNSSGFQQMRGQLKGIRETKVLDIGSGIGTFAIQMELQANQVTAVEPNETLIGFSKFREKKLFEAMMMQPGIVWINSDKWYNKAVDESFNIVTAFDVIEHIPLEELRVVIPHIARVLTHGGRLIFHNNFGQQEIYPMHFDHSAEWEQMIKDAGLVQISPLEAIKP